MDKFVKRIPRKCPQEHSGLKNYSIKAKSGGNAETSVQDSLNSKGETSSENASVEKVLKSELQQLVFSTPLLSDEYRLMEVSPALADRILAGDKLVFRGEPDDFPVLCSKNQSFDVKEVDISNTMLLLPEFHFNEEADACGNSRTIRKVIAMERNFLELREIKIVSTTRLKELLRESALNFNDRISENKKLYTVADLLDVVQMSEMELQKALEEMPVITLNGYIRMLSAEYCDRLVTELVDCLDDDEEPGINLRSVDIECLKGALIKHLPDKNIPPEAVDWLIRSYCDTIAESGTLKYIINERAICRAKISQLLRAAVCFEYSTFEKTLQQILPIGVELKEDYLEGLAFIDEALATGKTIRYLNVEDLPEDPVKRLEILFSLRQTWRATEMQQFLSDLCPTLRLLNELYLKYCRQTTVNGEKVLTGLKETVL